MPQGKDGGRALTKPVHHRIGGGGVRVAARLCRPLLAAALAPFRLVAISPTEAGVNDRTLSFYSTHTQERVTITFKRNGVYDPAGLQQINHILRDWRRDEPTTMDPRLIDLVW